MSGVTAFLESVADIVRKRDVFGDLQIGASSLRCRAKDAAAEAWYSLEQQDNAWRISLYTRDRWLSESIETDLMHHGDPLEELIEEELVDLGGEGSVPPPKHFRADDKSYVFSNLVPEVCDLAESTTAVHVATWLLAYEAAFRNLGDMSGSDQA